MFDGMSSNHVLAYCWSCSLWTMVAEDEQGIVTVFGLTPDGNPWMVGTDKMWSYPMTVMKAGKKYVQKCLDEKQFLFNYVDSRNIVHIRWLMKLGFNFTGDSTTFNGVEFLYFEMRS